MEEVYARDGIAGNFLWDGKMLENLGDTTFAKKLINDKAIMSLITSPDSGGEELRWIRFKDFYITDYFYMEEHSWDAVIFIPKRTILFYGFGIMANYNSKDMKYRLKWVIDEEDEFGDEGVIYEIPDADKDPEKKWFTIRLADMGYKPIKVNEG